jgi:hypothetical protein
LSIRAQLVALELKTLYVGRGNFRRLQQRAGDNPRLADALASGRVEAIDARGRKLSPAQRARKERRLGNLRPVRQIAYASDGTILPVGGGNKRYSRSADLLEAARMKRPKAKRQRRR